jgi:hypothetical protein
LMPPQQNSLALILAGTALGLKDHDLLASPLGKPPSERHTLIVHTFQYVY